jgi:serpin B
VATGTQQALTSDQPHDTTPELAAGQYESYIAGLNTLGLSLFRSKAALKNQNTVFSPVSLDIALSMAYAGAKGQTATEMKTVLGDPFGDITYHRAVNRLAIDLRSRNVPVTNTERPQSVELSLLDQMFVQRNFSIYRSYIDLMGTHYAASVRLADFQNDLEGTRLLINQFASDATKGKITDLIRQGDITPLTRVVLANALYLTASWKSPFDTKQTGNADFVLASGETVTASTMNATDTFAYVAGNDYQAVQVPYYGDSLSMLLVLPSEGKFASVRDSMTPQWLRVVESSATPKNVKLSLPKFRFSYGTEEFNEELKALGMPTAFIEGVADFTGIHGTSVQDSLFIFKVLQKAFVGVDESGTEAAAVSAVVLNWKSAPVVDATVNLNRPFLFSILDKTGAVLFAGQVMDPRPAQ